MLPWLPQLTAPTPTRSRRPISRVGAARGAYPGQLGPKLGHVILENVLVTEGRGQLRLSPVEQGLQVLHAALSHCELALSLLGAERANSARGVSGWKGRAAGRHKQPGGVSGQKHPWCDDRKCPQTLLKCLAGWGRSQATREAPAAPQMLKVRTRQASEPRKPPFQSGGLKQRSHQPGCPPSGTTVFNTLLVIVPL